MRLICAATLLAAATFAHAEAAEISVISPGVISNSGLREVAAAFQAKTGIKVNIIVSGMGEIVGNIKTKAPAVDVMMLPVDLMATLDLEGGIAGDDFTPLGRVDIGLFVKPGAPHPDIANTEKLIAALKTASIVFYSDPVSGSMQAAMSDRMLKRPDFAGVHSQGVKGDAEPALKRGDGDQNAMGLGLIHGVHNRDGKPTDNPYLVGPLPFELGMHMDMATGVNTRSADRKDAEAFIRFAISPEMKPLWRAGGTDRY
ncbi:MAG TPA: substrate-binding domain-containing protein [Rhizomicrobium sp.]|jgi:molybdate transport system substrate-binding protein|nr:substrate-binding domain-containing protein [Rhizomicrobium sp.]